MLQIVNKVPIYDIISHYNYVQAARNKPLTKLITKQWLCLADK